jgi:hypothetical protein
MRIAPLAAVLLAASTAHADGFYYSQAYGISGARGDGAAMLGSSLQLRVALGWRFGALTVGPLVTGNLAFERDHAYLGLIGGDPIAGDSDLKTYGLDARYHAALNESTTKRVVMYVRGGPRYATGLGALDPYSGPGFGVATGLQLTGQVRALGFLFAPLFFTSWGPKITASVFVDESVDWYRLSADHMPALSMPIVGTAVGIGAGSHF